MLDVASAASRSMRSRAVAGRRCLRPGTAACGRACHPKWPRPAYPHRSDAFRFLEAQTPQQFDVVVLDPPKFARSQRDLPAALQGGISDSTRWA